MKVEAALLHLRLKEVEKDEVVKDRSLRSPLPTPRTKVIEAQAPKGKRRRYAVKNGKPQVHANMGTNADSHTYQLADTTSKGIAKKEMHAHIPIGLAVSIRQKQTNLQRDLLSDCQ